MNTLSKKNVSTVQNTTGTQGRQESIRRNCCEKKDKVICQKQPYITIKISHIAKFIQEVKTLNVCKQINQAKSQSLQV